MWQIWSYYGDLYGSNTGNKGNSKDQNIGNEGNSKVLGQGELMNNAVPKETPITGHNFGP